jgi:hypothetical protein
MLTNDLDRRLCFCRHRRCNPVNSGARNSDTPKAVPWNSTGPARAAFDSAWHLSVLMSVGSAFGMSAIEQVATILLPDAAELSRTRRTDPGQMINKFAHLRPPLSFEFASRSQWIDATT